MVRTVTAENGHAGRTRLSNCAVQILTTRESTAGTMSDGTSNGGAMRKRCQSPHFAGSLATKITIANRAR